MKNLSCLHYTPAGLRRTRFRKIPERQRRTIAQRYDFGSPQLLYSSFIKQATPSTNSIQQALNRHQFGAANGKSQVYKPGSFFDLGYWGDRHHFSPNMSQLVLKQEFAIYANCTPWAEVSTISGCTPRLAQRRARFNAMPFGLGRAGYITLGQLCKATGVPDSTICDWEKEKRIPKMPRLRGKARDTN